MPVTRVAPDLEMHYLLDDYTDPWTEAETILMLHGNAERGLVWFGWVPQLGRHFRLVRPDMRGFGESTPMPRDHVWSLDTIVDDYMALMKTLGIERFHVVGAKLGGTMARHLAARHPESVRTLTLVGSPPPRRDITSTIAEWVRDFEQYGVEHWARKTMANRLGSSFPPEGVEWWIKLMGKTAASTQIGFVPQVNKTDISADLPRIKCPTLVITNDGSSHGSVDEMRAWQSKIPNSTLLVLPGDSFHAAATHSERCAQETLEFIRRVSK